MNNYQWYEELVKPTWSPPAELFAPVWTVLYVLIVISFGTVFWEVINKRYPAKIALPFVLNLFFNIIFTPIQFGLKNNLLAAADISFVLVTLVWLMASMLKIRKLKWVAFVNIPYLMWVLFATVLQFTVTYLNI